MKLKAGKGENLRFVSYAAFAFVASLATAFKAVKLWAVETSVYFLIFHFLVFHYILPSSGAYPTPQYLEQSSRIVVCKRLCILRFHQLILVG
jgi:hypothetical protein